MIDENEDGVSKHGRQGFALVFPVPQRRHIRAIPAQVVGSTNHHHPQYDNASVCREDLEPLGVLDVTEAKANAEKAEDKNAHGVSPCDIVISAKVTSGYESNALVQRLCTGNILEAHSSIHVDDQDSKNRVFDPGSCDTVSNRTQFELLANIVRALLVLSVSIIRAPLDLGSLVALLFKDGVTAPVVVLCVCHRNDFNHVGG